MSAFDDLVAKVDEQARVIDGLRGAVATLMNNDQHLLGELTRQVAPLTRHVQQHDREIGILADRVREGQRSRYAQGDDDT